MSSYIRENKTSLLVLGGLFLQAVIF